MRFLPSRLALTRVPVLVLALVLALALAFLWLPLSAQTEVMTFDDAQQKQLYQKLTKELRCLVCQNQNLADSNADLAKDLRLKAYEMILQGKDYDQIVGYMVERYGDFVIYRPPLKGTTLILWFAPIVLIVAAIVLAIVKIRRSSGVDTPSYNEQELERAKRLLDDGPLK